MKRFLTVAALGCLLCAGTAHAQSNSNSPLGTNLNGVAYWTPEMPFIDISKQNIQFWTQTSSTWDTGEEKSLCLDANGWPTTITKKLAADGTCTATPTFTKVSIVLNRLDAPFYPSGQYDVFYDGACTLQYGFDASVVSQSLGHDIFNVANPSGGGIYIQIVGSGADINYCRNIRVMQSSLTASYQAGEIFNPAFLSTVNQFRVLRFMDWMCTNASKQTTWANRPTISMPFYGADTGGASTLPCGTPVEVMVALANKLGADAWFPMPHMADDNYITQFATLVHGILGANQKVYVEYSNETWNYGFVQATWVQQQGQAMWPNAPSPFEANRSYHGMRTAQACDLWKQAWGADASRVVCVLAAQAANAWTATNSLDCPLWSGRPCSGHGIGAVAIAPYFGYDVPNTWTLDQLFAEITQGAGAPNGYPGGMIKQALDWVASYKTAIQPYGLPIIAYEGGQSLVNPNDASLTTLYIAANRDSRMGSAYTTYLNGWKQAGVQLFTHFSDVGGYSKWGSWGSLETIMTPSSPKYNALQAFITNNACWWPNCSGGGSPPPPVNGVCGPANGVPVSTAPTTGLCSAGTPTTVSGSGPWTWSCQGSNGGTTAMCSAPVASAVSPTVTINSPPNGATYVNGAINISVTASDPAGISSIQIYGDASLLATCTNVTSCSATWQAKRLSRGQHTITGKATDTGGRMGQASVTITVATHK